jgi:hypothetical protein
MQLNQMPHNSLSKSESILPAPRRREDSALIFVIGMLVALSISLTSCGGAGSAIKPPLPSQLVWTWQGGPIMPGDPGSYGTIGVASAQNLPTARYFASCVTRSNGSLLLFGGWVIAQGKVPVGNMNDLWTYSNGEWTWLGGSDTYGSMGSYGTVGVASKQNWPPARSDAASWMDNQGNFWVFSGGGSTGDFDDLWKYSNGEWTWMGGSNQQSDSSISIFGMQGVPSPSNLPGGRFSSQTWVDSQGNLWLYGGFGTSSQGFPSPMGDMWRYSNGEWAWVSGDPRNPQPPSYGTQGVAAPTNSPGARYDAMTWTDSQGNFWLFGGISVNAANGAWVYSNDLWKYSNSEWTWLGGTNTASLPPVYGTLNTPSPTNQIGARKDSVTWIDSSGNLWLFGGYGLDTTGQNLGFLNDLWRYSNGQWTWMAGSDTLNSIGSWGTLGVPSLQNAPESREYSCGWKDSSDNLWLFGGDTEAGFHNDLWEFTP